MPPKRREQQRLGEELPDELRDRPAPSDRRTAISAARAADAREQQVRDVRARDEQHERR